MTGQTKKMAELELDNCGMEQCNPGYTYGPAVRTYYLVHYILRGKGKLEAGGVTYELQAGQGFVIFPYETTRYMADKEQPWEYVWAGCGGSKAKRCFEQAGFHPQNRIFTYDRDDALKTCMLSLAASTHFRRGRTLVQTGLLNQFLGLLIEYFAPDLEPPQQRYVREVVEYMERNYWRNITVKQLAQDAGLDRSYLSRLFREQTGVSPQQYLVNLRLERAAQLIQPDTRLSVSEVARSVGYEDPLAFSKMFKAKYGVAPSRYQKQP